MQGEFENISIEGIQVAIPSRVVDNMSFADRLGERRCKKQMRLTGVKERHLCQPGQTSADLVYAACKKLMENLGWGPETVDVLVFATQNPLFVVPSTAFFLQKRLGLSKDCVVFDVNLGCSAATVGIQTIASMLQPAREGARGIILIGDPCYFPAEKDPDKLADRLLFGAAGAAIALEKTDKPVQKLYFKNKSDGVRYQAIFRAKDIPFIMDGEGVFEFAINDVSSDIISFRESLNMKPEDIDYYVFHQAQALILSTIDDVCGIAPERELRSLEHYGNTNGSSIPVTLCANERELKKQETVKVLMCGFGVGLSWCSVIATLRSDRIFPILIDDTIYPWKKEFE